MNFSKFFIQRPIFAAVLSLMIVAAGAIALFQLPISEYPQVVPPTVVVRAAYPGANPKVIAETVASPIEQQINGIEDMLYMFSQATSDVVRRRDARRLGSSQTRMLYSPAPNTCALPTPAMRASSSLTRRLAKFERYSWS